MGLCDLPELQRGFRKGDVEDPLAGADAFEKELEGQGGFAGARVAFDEVEVPGGEAAVQDVVEAANTGLQTMGRAVGSYGGGRMRCETGLAQRALSCGFRRHLSALRTKWTCHSASRRIPIKNSNFRCWGWWRELHGKQALASRQQGVGLSCRGREAGCLLPIACGGAWDGVGLEEAIEGGAADPEHFGSADLIAVGAGEDARDMTEDGAVEVGVVAGRVGRGLGRGRNGPVQTGNIDGTNPLTGTLEGRGSDDRLELADVAGPVIGDQAVEDSGGEAAQGLPVLKAPVAQKEGGTAAGCRLCDRGAGEG